MSRDRRVRIVLTTLLACGVGLAAQAKLVMGRPVFMGAGGPAGPGAVNLPYMAQDSAGNNYRIFNGGWFQQNSNMPLYSQGAILTVNGQALQQNNNQGRIDGKTGELVLEGMSAAGCSVTRRVLVDKAGGYIRFIDQFKNTQAQPQTIQAMIQSTCNYGINAGQNVDDPKKKGQAIGWVGQTGANQSVVEMYAGKGSKVVPQVNWPQGNNVVQATYSLTIAPNHEVAIMHMHTVAPTQDAGTRFIDDLKEMPIIKSLPGILRREIVNFRGAQDFIGEIEILRGDLMDVVELRSGDTFKGNLEEKTYDLQTFYGNVSLPVDKVVGIINVGQFRPRQLLVTTDGQIFGGQLKKQTIELEMSSGQLTQIPLSQIGRVGYRKRPDEPQDWTFDKPMVVLRTGERVNIQMPPGPMEVVTRYGKLSLAPQDVAAVLLQNEENQVHEIELTDGSRFAGLLTNAQFDLKLESGGSGPEQIVKIPASAVARIQLTTKVKEADDDTPTIHLANEDQLNGALIGKLKLDTAFDTIEVNAPELRSLSHSPEGTAADVTAVLWDGTSLSGQLEDQDVSCQLVNGLVIKVPIGLLHQYDQPLPQPSAIMVEKIRKLVETDLSNEDWHVRDRGRAQLLSMGPAVGPVLKQIRATQSPEAQKTIDMILAELSKQRKSDKGAATSGPAAGNANPAAADQMIIEN